MNDVIVESALISVTDKSGLERLAKVLAARNVRILASSGTHRFLQERGVEAVEISRYTESPELLGGRVKTLHPKIHAGILADRNDPGHMDTLKQEGITPIDLVVVNLYPFREKRAEGELGEQELCEFIDIGGITLMRAAAKNYRSVAVVTTPSQYEQIIEEIENHGSVLAETRRRLAMECFRLTSGYDRAIAEFLAGSTDQGRLPQSLRLDLLRSRKLRYGENPHQEAAVYLAAGESLFDDMVQHQGKELSFNNYLDMMGAFDLARDLGEGTVAIIKHTNPCGAAWKGEILPSYRRALACDPVSAFGGIIAANGKIDREAAEEMNDLFLEVVMAEGFDGNALEVFSKKRNLRVIEIPRHHWIGEGPGSMGLYNMGAFLCQEVDYGFPELERPEVMTSRSPTEEEMTACAMAWKVAKHVKSNAIVVADGEGTVGIGAGQMSRVDSARIAVDKARSAGLELKGAVAASDAFFPFPDGVEELARNGITAVIQPGGSIRDEEVVAAADRSGMAMLFTGRRHFRHL